MLQQNKEQSRQMTKTNGHWLETKDPYGNILFHDSDTQILRKSYIVE